MFWKIIRWGGTIILVGVVILALVAANGNKEEAVPVPASSGSSFGL